MGKAKINLDKPTLERLMQFKPTRADTATIMGVDPVTLDTFIRANYDNISFSEFREKYMAELRTGLHRKAIEMAMNGNAVMMIFCLKNLCGWTDKVENTVAAKLFTIDPSNAIEASNQLKDKARVLLEGIE